MHSTLRFIAITRSVLPDVHDFTDPFLEPLDANPGEVAVTLLRLINNIALLLGLCQPSMQAVIQI